MPERDYTNDPEDFWRQFPDQQVPGGVTQPQPQPPSTPAPIDPGYVDPHIAETQRRWNGGSPPDMPLNPSHGWEWDGWDWNQVSGRGLGFSQPTPPSGPKGGTPPPPGPPPPGPKGFVPPINPAGNIPSSTLPGNIQGLFDQTPTPTPVQSAYQDALLKFMNRAQETPSLSDSTLSPQVEVFRVQQQRNQERNRRNAVERAAAQGMNDSGYVNNLINEGVQEQNFNTAMFNANLLGGEARKRREELLAALHLAQQTGNSEAERELRARLAQVSAAMQQQGLHLQGQLGFGDLALRALMAQMGNEQFYDQLGINSALDLERLNQRAVELLGR